MTDEEVREGDAPRVPLYRRFVEQQAAAGQQTARNLLRTLDRDEDGGDGQEQRGSDDDAREPEHQPQESE